MLIRRGAACAACLFAIAPAVHAEVEFSFGPGDNPDGPTFFGGPGGNVGAIITDGTLFNPDDMVTANLAVTQNGDTTVFGSRFEMNTGELGYSRVMQGGNFLHTWVFDGSFNFTVDGDLALAISFTNATVTSLSPNDNTLGSEATITATTESDPSLMFTAGPLLNDIGIFDADIAEGGFAMTLTDIQSVAFGELPFVDFVTGDFLEDWVSQGSFESLAVPGPAAGLLLGLGVLTGRRRRRRA